MIADAKEIVKAEDHQRYGFRQLRETEMVEQAKNGLERLPRLCDMLQLIVMACLVLFVVRYRVEIPIGEITNTLESETM